MEMLARESVGKYIVPPVIPRREEFNCFLEELKELVMLAYLKPSHQLAYIKQEVLDEVKTILYQHKVESV